MVVDVRVLVRCEQSRMYSPQYVPTQDAHIPEVIWCWLMGHLVLFLQDETLWV